MSLPHACNRLAEVQNRIEVWNRDDRRVRDTQALRPRQPSPLPSDPLRGRMSWSTAPAAWVQRPVHRTAQGVSESDPRMSSSPAFTIARAVWSYQANTAGLGFPERASRLTVSVVRPPSPLLRRRTRPTGRPRRSVPSGDGKPLAFRRREGQSYGAHTKPTSKSTKYRAVLA